MKFDTILLVIILTLLLLPFIHWLNTLIGQNRQNPVRKLALQTFDGTLAIDPSTVISLTITRQQRPGGGLADIKSTEPYREAMILTADGRVTASESAGRALLAYLVRSSPPSSYVEESSAKESFSTT